MVKIILTVGAANNGFSKQSEDSGVKIFEIINKLEDIKSNLLSDEMTDYEKALDEAKELFSSARSFPAPPDCKSLFPSQHTLRSAEYFRKIESLYLDIGFICNLT